MMCNTGKCPCCGYEFDYKYEKGKMQITKGDESFIAIYCTNDVGFETDEKASRYIIDYKRAYLYGCPKCRCVHFISC